MLLLFASIIIFSACSRGSCPAYMNGEVTGAEGSRDNKKQELFPKEMKKHN